MSKKYMQENWKNIYESVRSALRKFWDPLPGSPEDEYDQFALGITSLICNGRGDVEQVSDYLLEVELNELEIASKEMNAEQYHDFSKNILEFVRVKALEDG